MGGRTTGRAQGRRSYLPDRGAAGSSAWNRRRAPPPARPWPPAGRGTSASFPLERIDDFPVGLHVDHTPLAFDRLVPRLVEPANAALAVIGVLALGIGVMDQAHEAQAGSARRVLQHLLVAVGVAEGEDRTTA